MSINELTSPTTESLTSGRRILLVEDSATASRLISQALTDMGLEVIVAGTGPAALHGYAESYPDCVLLDVELPGGMSGYEVCAALREAGADEMIPVIFITARDGADDRLRGLALGALDFLGKPFEQPELVARVLNALRVRSLQERLADSEGRLERAGRTDVATGVANRRELSSQLTHACSIADRYGRPLSVILADIDHLRLVNDRSGIDSGDRVLVEFASIIKAASRDADVVGRFGDAEFMAICPETEVGGAAILGGRIRAVAEASLGSSLGDLAITASVGCAEKLPGEPPETLIRRCAQALDTAKLGGRNRVCVARTESAGPEETLSGS